MINWQWSSTSARSQVLLSITYDVWRRFDLSLVPTSQLIWSQLSSSADLTIAILCSPLYRLLPSHHCNVLKMQQHDLWKASVLAKGLGPRDHVTPALRDLHRLPVQHRITYKLCVLMHDVFTHRSPAYLSDLVVATSDIPSRSRLRSSNTNRYEQLATRLKFGERCFSHAGPKAWNSLPSNIQEQTDTKTFKQQLRTCLFNRAYADS